MERRRFLPLLFASPLALFAFPSVRESVGTVFRPSPAKPAGRLLSIAWIRLADKESGGTRNYVFASLSLAMVERAIRTDFERTREDFGPDVASGKWAHFAATKNDDGTILTYRNGKLEAWTDGPLVYSEGNFLSIIASGEAIPTLSNEFPIIRYR